MPVTAAATAAAAGDCRRGRCGGGRSGGRSEPRCPSSDPAFCCGCGCWFCTISRCWELRCRESLACTAGSCCCVDCCAGRLPEPHSGRPSAPQPRMPLATRCEEHTGCAAGQCGSPGMPQPPWLSHGMESPLPASTAPAQQIFQRNLRRLPAQMHVLQKGEGSAAVLANSFVP